MPGPVQYLDLFLRIDKPKKFPDHNHKPNSIEPHKDKPPVAQHDSLGHIVPQYDSSKIEESPEYKEPVGAPVAAKRYSLAQWVPIAHIHEQEGHEQAHQHGRQDQQRLPEIFQQGADSVRGARVQVEQVWEIEGRQCCHVDFGGVIEQVWVVEEQGHPLGEIYHDPDLRAIDPAHYHDCV